jgi:tetratricopeptide (TPR) repeat protein
MARFIEASLAPRVLREDTVRSMQRPANDISPAYGLGYSVIRIAEGITYVGHGGANTGWMANMGMILESGDGLMVMTNGSLGAGVQGQILCVWRSWLTGEENVCRAEVGPVIVSTTIRKGADAAIARYRVLQAESPDAYDFSESQLNRAGYSLLRSGRTADAIALLALNVEMFADSLPAHDSLGEAYMTAGDIDHAIASYRRSVELNPENTNGIEALARLKAMKDARAP